MPWTAGTRMDIDRVFQAVLDAPCGIVGLTLSALPQTPSERWLDGMLALVDWVLRLLPIDGPIRIDVAIEGRPPFPPKVDAQVAARNALARLARAWPERAGLLDLQIVTIDKHGNPLNGYVDALAFTWGSKAHSSKERLKLSGLKNTCFLTTDAETMKTFWDGWDQPGGLPPDQWAGLVASPEAQKRESVVHSLLAALADACRQTPSRLQPYLEEVRRHLGSKSIHLGQLGAQVEWLHSILQDSEDLTPAMRLAWLTARLARANHMGSLEQEWAAELHRLGERLREEDAPLVCHAHLHLAVNATNRFDFSGAARILEPWQDTDPAVPGLRYWGQIHSSLGQIAAFQGDPSGAIERFDKAVGAFRRLSDPAQSSIECSQTLCYKAVAAMDDHENTSHEAARECLEAYFKEMKLPGNLSAAARLLAQSADPALKYAHHVLLRYLVFRGDAQVRRTYEGEREHWKEEEGHPWPLIQLYRAILLREEGDALALDLAVQGAALAFSVGQGPTVQLIGACCRATAAAWGRPWAESGATLESLSRALPQAGEHIKFPAAWLEASQEDPRSMLTAVLPFNFR